MDFLKSGFWPVMLTPFNDDRSIDFAGLAELTNWYIDKGASGLFANCLSSEMFELDHDERLALVEHVLQVCNQRVKVVATGNFSYDIDEAIDFICKLTELGVDAVVLNTAFLANEHDNESVARKNLEKIMKKTDVPLGLYECPVPYKRLLSNDLLHWLAESGRFSFLKDTCCDVALIKERGAIVAGSDFKLFNAHVPSLLDSLEAGYAGASCCAGNYYPELLVTLCDNYKCEAQKAYELQLQLAVMDPAIRLNYMENSKTFLAMRGLNIKPNCRVETSPTNDSKLVVKRLFEYFNMNFS